MGVSSTMRCVVTDRVLLAILCERKAGRKPSAARMASTILGVADRRLELLAGFDRAWRRGALDGQHRAVRVAPDAKRGAGAAERAVRRVEQLVVDQAPRHDEAAAGGDDRLACRLEVLKLQLDFLFQHRTTKTA